MSKMRHDGKHRIRLTSFPVILTYMFQAIPTRVSATGAVIPTLRPGGWGIDRNPGVTIAPGVDINRIPRPATMIPPPPHEHPAAEMQRQYAQRDITRIYSPPPSAYPPTYPSYPSQAQAQAQGTPLTSRPIPHTRT